MKRPDYRTLQALDAVIRERGFERAAQKLCITQSAVSQRIKQLENMFGQPLLVRTVPPRPTEQGQKLLALLRQVELLEEEWLGDEQTGSTPLLLSLAVNTYLKLKARCPYTHGYSRRSQRSANPLLHIGHVIDALTQFLKLRATGFTVQAILNGGNTPEEIEAYKDSMSFDGGS